VEAVSDEGWEARMAARAAERASSRVVVEPIDDELREMKERLREMTRQAMAAVTLGEATNWLRLEPFGCACIGPPRCCVDRTRQARRMKRVAHLIAKAMDAKKRAVHPEG
jgi:hypothetical protein